MTSLNISLPKALKKYVGRQVASGNWGTPSEYIRDLIRRDKERRIENSARVHIEMETPAHPHKRPSARRFSKQMKSGLDVMNELIAERRQEQK